MRTWQKTTLSIVRRRRVSGNGSLVAVHELINRDQITIEMLAALDYLTTESSLSVFGGTRVFGGDVDNSGVGKDILGMFERGTVFVRNRGNWFI
jgi:hypothetical protein